MNKFTKAIHAKALQAARTAPIIDISVIVETSASDNSIALKALFPNEKTLLWQ